jgi:DNA topoisomerase VI subunit B
MCLSPPPAKTVPEFLGAWGILGQKTGKMAKFAQKTRAKRLKKFLQVKFSALNKQLIVDVMQHSIRAMSLKVPARELLNLNGQLDVAALQPEYPLWK